MKSRWYPQSMCIALALGLALLVPQWAVAHEVNREHDLERLEKKPEGMIEFEDKKTPAQPGQEYAQPTPKKDSMEHMDHEKKDDLFHTRGAHQAMGMGEGKTDKPQALLARGKNIYLHMCIFCHGADGNGGGAAVEYLFPWPRDFRQGIFKFRSTPSGTLPRDEDLYRTIVKGVPGTSMPAWGPALSPEDVWALVNLIKSFSPRFRTEPPGQKIAIGEPPPATDALAARGQELYKTSKCAKCHGDSGKGDGELSESLMDAWKHAVFVHSITNPVNFKNGSSPKDIFRTLSTGLDGMPMESYATLPENDRWALVHFLRSRFAKEVEKAETETDIYSYRTTGKLDTDVNNPVWKSVKTTTLYLRPLSARRGAVETVEFASVNDGKKIAVRMTWSDPTANEFIEGRSDYFRDGAAVQFALGDATLHTHGHNEPFFGMGNRGKTVNIWHWKAGLAQSLAAEAEIEYSTGGVDMDSLVYGGLMSNPVAKLNPTKENAVEELNAEGFGTISPQADEYQNVEGFGQWEKGVWTAVFLRDMEAAGKWDAQLKDRKDPALVAFAVWDGEKEDRNGRKVVSVWQRLHVLDK